jgi:hypothetical protein
MDACERADGEPERDLTERNETFSEHEPPGHGSRDPSDRGLGSASETPPSTCLEEA